MLLVIDNYDSFTYNLVQYLGELGAEVSVRRNDEIAVEEIGELAPSAIVLSPGPCTPVDAGITVGHRSTLRCAPAVTGDVCFESNPRTEWCEVTS